MDNEMNNSSPVKQGIATQMLDWLDARTGVRGIMKKVLDEPIPGGARFAYVFGSGLLFIFLLQVVTGVSLALYYTPTAETAHTSVAYISKQVAGGAFLRSLHSYGSSAMIIVLGLHFLQTFLYGSFKGRRELLWISGALLSFLVLGMAFTGYLLPWDQKAYFATAVGTNVAGEAPLIGNLLTRLLRGGDTIGTLTLSRFYLAHVFLIPATIFLFIGAHILLFRRAGPAGPVHENAFEPKLATEPFYPRQVLLDMGFVLVIMAVLGGLSYLHPVSLGPIADPSDTHFLPRPEWYCLPMFEWLKFWEGPRVVIGVVVIPGLLAMAFFLMPFLDRRLERKPWRRPIPALAVAVVVLGMVYLGAKSQIDDRDGPIAAQLELQAGQEKAYSAAPFEPYVESRDGIVQVAAGKSNPLVGEGKGIFTARGCIGCHGTNGTGTVSAPSLVGVTGKYGGERLVALLQNPNPKMRASGMPAVNGEPHDMSALLAYLAALGTSAASVPAIYNLPSPPPSAANRVSLNIAMNSKSLPRTAASGDANRLNALVSAGQQVFQEHACFACHGAAGSGGRAPAIAPLIAELSDADLAQLLQIPNGKMKAGGMPSVDGTPQQIGSLISYLRSLPARSLTVPKTANQDAAEQVVERAPVETPLPKTDSTPKSLPAVNPPPPAVAGGNAAIAEAAGLAAGRSLFVSQGCVACHGSNGRGTAFAPPLLGVGNKFPGEKLTSLLHHPTDKMRKGGMPAVTVNDGQLLDLTAYLSSLEGAPLPHRKADPESEPKAHLEVPSTQQSSARHEAHLVYPLSQAGDVKADALNPLAMRGRVVFQRNACGTCHGAEGRNGTPAAPGLAGTASLLPESALENLLRHHSERMQKGGMPLTNFKEQDMKAVVAYIRSMSASPEAEKLVASGSGN